MHKKIVIFDIDGTLFYSNSTFDFIIWWQKKNMNSFKNIVLRSLFYKIITKISVSIFKIDLRRNSLIKSLNGVSRDDLTSHANAFYDEYLKHRINNNVMKYIKEYKDFNIILVSATLDFLAEVIAKKITMQEKVNHLIYFSTKLGYQNGICTGKIEEDLLNKKLQYLHFVGIFPPFYAVFSDDIFDAKLMEQSDKSYIIITKKNSKEWNKYISIRSIKNYYLIDA